MSDYMELYFASDNTAISPAGEFTNSVDITVRADLNEISDGVELYAEASENFQVLSARVDIVGDSSDKWRLALTEEDLGDANWGDSLELGTVGAGVGGRVPFWIQARALDTEDPVIDVTTILDTEGIADPAP